MNILNKFLEYVSISTPSSATSITSPSTKEQFRLASLLAEELKTMGLEVTYDTEHCYVYGVLKGQEDLPKIGFISHMDVSPDAPSHNIKPQIIENYDGKDIALGKSDILKIDMYPNLLEHKGKTIITTDGTTLLGADDKAGIVAIMAMLEYFTYSNESHGDIYVCFTPDEEIGLGVEYFDFDKFKAPYAYTVDGSAVGEICYENFNAAKANINIKGKNTHCGSAKGLMINSLLIANELNAQLTDQVPANTEGYEGFFHIERVNGTVENTEIEYLIRDFDKDGFEARKKKLMDIVDNLNIIYNDCINLEIKDQYYNMKDIITQNKNYHLVENAKKAIEKAGINSIVEPIRGGTDGTDLTYQGLPCPNLGTGGYNYHSTHEYVCLEDMEKNAEILINIVKEYAKSGPKLTRK